MKKTPKIAPEKIRPCIIPGCTSNMPAVISFPSIQHKRDIWYKCIKKSLAHLGYINWKTWKLPAAENRNERICAYHFDKRDFLPSKSKVKEQKRIRLKQDALPIIFQDNSDDDAQDDQDLKQREMVSISMESMERATSFLAKDFSWNSLVPSDELRHCNAQFEASQRYQGHIDAQPQQTPSAVLEHIRSALLRHRWNDVAKLLPYFFHFWDFKPFIWKTALQVVCHHPESSEIEMMNLIRTCLQVSVVPDDYLRKIFCVQSFEDSVPIPFKGKKVNHKKGAKKHSRKSHK